MKYEEDLHQQPQTAIVFDSLLLPGEIYLDDAEQQIIEVKVK